MAAQTEMPHGYQKKFFLVENESKLNKFLCGRCGLVVREPVQHECGHRFCKECAEVLVSEPEPMCPKCKADGNSDDECLLGKDNIFPDFALKRELGPLQIVCLQKDFGCEWTGQFKDYQKHVAECVHRPVNCSYCSKEFPMSGLTEHEEGCDSNLVRCDGCRQRIVRKDMEAHKLKCPAVKTEGADSKAGAAAGHSMPDILPHDSSAGGDEYKAVVKKLAQLEEAMKSTAAAGGITGGQITDIVKTLTTDIARVERKYEQAEKTCQELGQKHKELEKKYDALKRVSAIKDVALADVAQRLDDLEVSTYDGKLVWRVTEVQRKRDEAVSGRCTSVFSPPFYTNHRGYKMCARLYLNGDGVGKSTHMSLFFVMKRGHFDAFLEWPFSRKVTLKLLDQSERRNHHVESFRPEPTSASFKRPTSTMNVASGCPSFLPIGNLFRAGLGFPEYVVNDTLFVVVEVQAGERHPPF